MFSILFKVFWYAFLSHAADPCSQPTFLKVNTDNPPISVWSLGNDFLYEFKKGISFDVKAKADFLAYESTNQRIIKAIKHDNDTTLIFTAASNGTIIYKVKNKQITKVREITLMLSEQSNDRSVRLYSPLVDVIKTNKYYVLLSVDAFYLLESDYVENATSERYAFSEKIQKVIDNRAVALYFDEKNPGLIAAIQRLQSGSYSVGSFFSIKEKVFTDKGREYAVENKKYFNVFFSRNSEKQESLFALDQGVYELKSGELAKYQQFQNYITFAQLHDQNLFASFFTGKSFYILSSDKVCNLNFKAVNSAISGSVSEGIEIVAITDDQQVVQLRIKEN